MRKLSGDEVPLSSVSEVSAELAEAVKNLRKASGFTQAELAKQAGVSTSFISQLERSSSDVTFSTLNRICQALGTTVGHLFAPPAPAGRLLRKDNYRYLDYNGVDKWVLTREEMIDVDICLFDFPIGSSTGLRQPPVSERTELWYCQGGYLGVERQGTVHVLRPGDSIDFPSSRPNTIYNAGPERCSALLVIKNHEPKRGTDS
ncbi:XRE family transcriptional regulator [Brevibacterium sp. 91QC2O2]|uniref:helix-turn-helix domain-containing protein n=1 Tax=Brevibacterium sp. 91QC2O2 TaxID=2968458 RepID=UPI00211C7116|nr:XRE family transcriptional regulator [Brevibacterium sp. 91QC2O2]MCQ9368827.1 XRE family transcriptional regulator [Brevibacterium sp. 91QC2O2]